MSDYPNNEIEKIEYFLCDSVVPWSLLLVWTPIQSPPNFRNPQENAKKANQRNGEKCKNESKVQVTIQKHL